MDPEIFVSNAAGQIVPAWKFLQSERQTRGPRAATDSWRAVRAYWDGFQAEFSHYPNIVPKCHELLTCDVQEGLSLILQTAQNAGIKGAKLVAEDVVRVEPSDLQSADDKYVRLGCAPSRNIYPQAVPISIGDGRELPIRFSGCHLHISAEMNEPPSWWPNGVVAHMDKHCGLLLTALGRGLENPERRVFYGRPGEYRAHKTKLLSPIGGFDTVYRIEYRTPGSFILRHPAAFMFAVDTCRAAFRLGMESDGRLSDIPDVYDTIVNCDADNAWRIIARNKGYFESFLLDLYNPDGDFEPSDMRRSVIKMLNTLKRGLTWRVGRMSIEKAWRLDDLNESLSDRWWGSIHGLD